MFYMSEGLRVWQGNLASTPTALQTFAMTHSSPAAECPFAWRQASPTATEEVFQATFCGPRAKSIVEGGQMSTDFSSMEFEESALLVDSFATFVGELHRNEQGELWLLPGEDPVQPYPKADAIEKQSGHRINQKGDAEARLLQSLRADRDPAELRRQSMCQVLLASD